VNEKIHIDLKKTIELVYNQFSPDIIQAKNFLNSPSERATTSKKRKYLSLGSQANFEKKKSEEERKTERVDLYVKKPEITRLNSDNFNKILKINTPKLTLFTQRISGKMSGGGTSLKKNPLSNIYKSKALINILKVQKQNGGKSFTKTKKSSASALAFTAKCRPTKMTNLEPVSNFAKFKIRKYSNGISAMEENNKKGTVHQQFKSNASVLFKI